MKRTSKVNTAKKRDNDEIEKEYHFDYTKAKPNRFSPRLIPIDEDIVKIFTTPESINNALRSIISAFPKKTKKRTVVNV